MSKPFEILTVKHVQSVVAGYFDQDVACMMSERRAQAFTEPRHIAMYFCYKLIPVMSLPNVGKYFNRDHTTIMHALKRVKEKLNDEQYLSKLNTIEELILKDKIVPTVTDRSAELMALDLAEAFHHAVLRLAAKDPVEFIRRVRTIVQS